ncbi:MAG: c-type cytochrome domain-containing protein [Prosthecobacter sp.]
MKRIAFALLLNSCAAPLDSETKPLGENVLTRQQIQEAKHGSVDFISHVKPLLEAKCVMCHNCVALPGHMSLENRAEAMRSGALGTFIVPGSPENSLLISHTHSAHTKMSVMPVVGERLTEDEYEILTKWVKEGARWPAGDAGKLKVLR